MAYPGSPADGEIHIEGAVRQRWDATGNAWVHAPTQSGIIQFGGQFLIGIGETRGWGTEGIVNDVSDALLATGAATDYVWGVGGVEFPFEVRLKRLTARWRATGYCDWGWRLSHMPLTEGWGDVTPTFVLDERLTMTTVDVGTGQSPKLHDIDLGGAVVAAGRVINLAVAGDSGNAAQYNLQLTSGTLEWEQT